MTKEEICELEIKPIIEDLVNRCEKHGINILVSYTFPQKEYVNYTTSNFWAGSLADIGVNLIIAGCLVSPRIAQKHREVLEHLGSLVIERILETLKGDD